MSVTDVSSQLPTLHKLQKLEENAMLIKAINERQSLGNFKDCIKYVYKTCCRRSPIVFQPSLSLSHPPPTHTNTHRYQQKLQQNLLQLAALADAQAIPQNLAST